MKLLVAANLIFASSNSPQAMLCEPRDFDYTSAHRYDYETCELRYRFVYDTGEILGPNGEGFKSNFSNLI